MADGTIIGGEDLRSYLGLGEAESATRLEELAQAAGEYLATALARTFAVVSYTDELYHGTGTRELVLRHYPVTELVGVTLEDTPLDVATTSDVELADAANGVLVRTNGDVWAKRPTRTIKVSYKAGLAEVPWVVRAAALELAAWAYQTTGGRLTLSTGGQAVSFAALSAQGFEGLPFTQAALERYADVLGLGRG